ncbi:hypothetical protein DMA15_17505 [Streptomyces sp. WAC 01529]|uniref:hypothetical protein n=1 Tax=Streptomyces sp. WAC 01529 TaxID=2203205 RepID=UPI000F6B5CD8|nr:hypothetical protein [Streptomyces sp. WAC 01529]AZM54145.1 hypothetical protein DMA15_17505 [Streptomyces sp. WAC 01529]
MKGTRYTADTITDNALDELYQRVARAEEEADAAVAAAARLTTLVGQRSERAERATEKQRRRAEIAESELHTLRSGLRANGADPTNIQNLWAQIRLRNRQWHAAKRECDQNAAAIERARALATRWAVLRTHGSAAAELRAALDERKEQSAP